MSQYLECLKTKQSINACIDLREKIDNQTSVIILIAKRVTELREILNSCFFWELQEYQLEVERQKDINLINTP
jgi:hypothetical protein